MSIKLILDPILDHLTGNTREMEVEGATIGECLNAAVSRFPSARPGFFQPGGELIDYLNVLLNGKSAFPDELNKKVKDGDEIRIVLIVGGG